METIWNIITVGGPLYAILVQCIFGYARRGLPYYIVTGPTTVIGTCIGWYLVLLYFTNQSRDPTGSAYLLMGYIMMANLLIIVVTTVLLMLAVVVMGRRLNTRP